MATRVSTEGTRIIFGSNVDKHILFNIKDLASGGGQISDSLERNTTSAQKMGWRGTITLTNPDIIGASIDIYLVTTESGIVDGNLPDSDTNLSDNEPVLKNCTLIGSIRVDKDDVAGPFIASGTFLAYGRYLQLVVINNTTQDIADLDLNKITIWELE